MYHDHVALQLFTLLKHLPWARFWHQRYKAVSYRISVLKELMVYQGKGSAMSYNIMC